MKLQPTVAVKLHQRRSEVAPLAQFHFRERTKLSTNTCAKTMGLQSPLLAYARLPPLQGGQEELSWKDEAIYKHVR